MRCPFSDLSRGQKWTSWTWWHPLSDQLIAVIIYCRWNFMTVSCHSSSLVLTDTMSYTKSHYMEIIPFDIVSQPTFWIIYNYVIWSGNWVTQAQDTAHRIVVTVVTFSCLRLRQWPVTYLMTLSDWTMSCQPGPPRARYGQWLRWQQRPAGDTFPYKMANFHGVYL